ncbi:hypothetical protein OROGR_033954 [Orobanche gracilis]
MTSLDPIEWILRKILIMRLNGIRRRILLNGIRRGSY